MQSRPSLMIFLAVALAIASNASAQAHSQSSASASASASASSYASAGINEPVVIEIETPEDHQEPSHVKDGKHHDEGQFSQPAHHPHPVEDQENSWPDATYEVLPSGEAYDSNARYPTKTVADEGQDSESNGSSGDPYSTQSGTQSYRKKTSRVSEIQYVNDMGSNEDSSYSPNQSDNANHSSDTQQHDQNHVSQGRHQEKTSSTGKGAASNADNQETSTSDPDDDDLIRTPMFEYPDEGKDGQTFDEEDPYNKNEREEDNEDEIYPTRVSGTPTRPSSRGDGHPAGYLGVPTGEQPYCQGPTDPETGKGIIDINGRCTIVCYNNLVLNGEGDNCICPPNLHLDQSHSRCVCHSPYVLSGGKCVLPPSQRAHQSNHKKRSMISQIPMGEELLHGKYVRTEKDRINCPPSEIACPLPSGDFECLDPEFTLDSCGGCVSNGSGVDCWALEGVSGVGCDAGRCLVFSCLSDYELVNGSCVPRKR
ncbi:secreted protein [Melampsora americana]|nr:secreted protein [Melampsora americana]